MANGYQTKVADDLWDDISFGWEMVRHVKSNAIVLAKDTSLIGVGAGQMSRVDSVEISIDKAGDRAKGSILASDAFFPFPTPLKQRLKLESSPSSSRVAHVVIKKSSMLAINSVSRWSLLADGTSNTNDHS